MATEKYMVEFCIPAEIDTPHDTAGASATIINEILEHWDQDKIQDQGYHMDHGEEIDNHSDGQDTIVQAETWVSIRFKEESESLPWDGRDVDMLDSIFKAARKALQMPGAHISNCWEYTDEDLTKKVIEITTYER